MFRREVIGKILTPIRNSQKCEADPSAGYGKYDEYATWSSIDPASPVRVNSFRSEDPIKPTRPRLPGRAAKQKEHKHATALETHSPWNNPRPGDLRIVLSVGAKQRQFYRHHHIHSVHN